MVKYKKYLIFSSEKKYLQTLIIITEIYIKQATIFKKNIKKNLKQVKRTKIGWKITQCKKLRLSIISNIVKMKM